MKQIKVRFSKSFEDCQLSLRVQGIQMSMSTGSKLEGNPRKLDKSPGKLSQLVRITYSRRNDSASGEFSRFLLDTT